MASGATDRGRSIYGSEFHGNAHMDGTATFASFASKVGSAYTLTTDLFAGNLIVDFGVTVITNGWRIFTAGALFNSGVIKVDGNAGSGVTAGAATATNTVGQGFAGGNGGSTTGTTPASSSSSYAGSGGGGGASGGNAGGTGGVASSPVGAIDPPFAYHSALGKQLTGTAVQKYVGGMGGGGGGGDGSNSGGGGGSGGGVLVICGLEIVNSGTISSIGGSGAAGVAGNAAGGGGGGGGHISLIYDSYAGLDPIVAGGVPGNGVGSGAAGVAGSLGIIVRISNT